MTFEHHVLFVLNREFIINGPNKGDECYVARTVGRTAGGVAKSKQK